MGVVVRRYIDFLILPIPTPLVLVLFLQQHPYFFVHLKKMNFRSLRKENAELRFFTCALHT